MSRTLIRAAHAAAGGLAFALVAAFFLSTVAVEVLGGAEAVAAVKTFIAWGLLALVPCLALAGASGLRLTGGRPAGLAAVKARRMAFAAANGLAVLVPAALFLAWKAAAGVFDAAFAAVQAAELAAGLANLVLLGLNLRDGLAMARARRARAAG